MDLLPRTFLALAISSSLLALAAGSAAVCAESSVPPGFEELLLGQREKVDVMLFGHSLGLFDAEVKPDTLQFLHPDALAQSLKKSNYIKPEFKQALLIALAPPLQRNGHLMCQSGHSGCGYVESDAVAVIFDENRNAIDLFINPAWLLPATTIQKYHQASPDSQSALIHNQIFNWAMDNRYSNLSARGTGALGLGSSRYLATNWNAVATHTRYSSQQKFQVQDLWLRQDLDKSHYLQAGLMDQTALASSLGGNFNFSLLPMPLFTGLRAGTTQAWLNQQAATDNATPVALLLNREARVDIYRGSQLLGSQYMSAGLQTLNTRNFPGGSYPLQLRIFENDTFVRSEDVAFSKSAGGLGDGSSEWFVQGGQVAPSAFSKAIAGSASWQAGFRFRLLRSMLFTSGISSLNERLFNENRIDWQTAFASSTLSTSASIMHGSKNVHGNAQQVSLNNGVNWSVYRHQQRGSVCQGRKEIDSLSCGDTLSASVSTQLAGWTATLGHTRSTQSLVYAPLQHPQPWQTPRVSLDKSRQQSTQLSLAKGLTWGNLSLTGRIGIFNSRQQEKSDRGMFFGITLGHIARPPSSATRNSQTSAQVDHRSSHFNGAQTYWSTSHTESIQETTFREGRVAFSGNQQGDFSTQLTGRVDGRYGNLNATLSHSQQQQMPAQRSLTGGYDSTLVTTGDAWWWSGAGNGQPSGATLVQVNGDNTLPAGPALEVQGMGRTVTLGLGESTALPLAGWQLSSTEVRESSSGEGFASIIQGAGRKTPFIRPGQLITYEVSAQTTWTLVGRAIADDKGLSHGIVLNSDNQSLDAQGGFVLDIHKPIKTLYIMQAQQFYTCPLIAEAKRDAFTLVGEVDCQPVALAALPKDIAQGNALAMTTIQEKS